MIRKASAMKNVFVCLFTMLVALPAAPDGRPVRRQVTTLGVNRLSNPQFDTNITGWSQIYGLAPAWDDRNHTDSSGSGSLRNTTAADASPTQGFASGQCSSGLTPGSVLRFGGWAMLPGGQTRNAVGYLALRFHTAAQPCFHFESVSYNNNGDVYTEPLIGGSTPFDTWIEEIADAVVPPLADKVDFQLAFAAGTGTGPAQVLYDNVLLTELGFAHKADLNRDGSQEIVWRNYATGQNAIWFMNGASLGSVYDLPALPNTDYRLEGAADFDFDGDSDLLWRNQATGQNAVWIMNNWTFVSITDLPALPNTNFRFEGTGDFNLDGKPDIVIRNATTGQNAIWLLNGTTLVGIVDLPALANPNFRIEGIGDFNGDLKYDILWRNYATGQNAVWLMNGNVFTGIVDLPALPNTNYRIDAAGDLNRDYRPDVIWRNAVTGQNAVWIMNGTSISSITDLPALPNVSFQMGAPR